MCTVVCRWSAGEQVRILALRDEFVQREFDEPGAWWPSQPTAIGGRDRLAGGTWCATDVTTGVTGLLVNRIERFEGTPSRGLLPLAAIEHGERWVDVVDHREMASFNLVLAGPTGVTVWVWDATTLQRYRLSSGTHMITSWGVDADDLKTLSFAPRFNGAESWLDVVTGCEPSDADGALVVRREHEGRTYATVFGQFIDTPPGQLRIAHTRTPWQPGTWVEQTWP